MLYFSDCMQLMKLKWIATPTQIKYDIKLTCYKFLIKPDIHWSVLLEIEIRYKYIKIFCKVLLQKALKFPMDVRASCLCHLHYPHLLDRHFKFYTLHVVLLIRPTYLCAFHRIIRFLILGYRFRLPAFEFRRGLGMDALLPRCSQVQGWMNRFSCDFLKVIKATMLAMIMSVGYVMSLSSVCICQSLLSAC